MIHSVRISEISDDDTDEEWDSKVTIYYNAEKKPQINAARADETKPNAPTDWRELVNRILKRKVETESKYAASKAPILRNWQPLTVTDEKRKEKPLEKMTVSPSFQPLNQQDMLVPMFSPSSTVSSQPFIASDIIIIDTDMQNAPQAKRRIAPPSSTFPKFLEIANALYEGFML